MKKKDAEAVFRGLAEEVRQRKNEGESIPHIFFLLVPGVQPLMIDVSELLRLQPDLTKDEVAQFVKLASLNTGARYVIQMTEAWCLATDKHPGSIEISKHPDRQEIIMLTIDGVDYNSTIMMAIENDRVVGENKEVVGTFDGRFSNMSGNVGIN
jgi:hypothetical protein